MLGLMNSRAAISRFVWHGGLADAGFATHHQHAATPSAHAVSQLVEHLALAFPAEQLPSPGESPW